LLVESLVVMGRQRESLEAWEWYRSAPLRNNGFFASRTNLPFASVTFPVSATRQGSQLTVVIARLEDGLVIWSVGDPAGSVVHMARESTTSERVLDMAQAFTALCSDRDSSEEDISVLGTHLYQALLAPFDNQIQRATEIAFDVDPSLERLPFAALMRPDHRYLSDSRALSFLSQQWTLHAPQPTTVPADATALLVEGAVSLPNSRGELRSSIPAADLQAEAIAPYFRHVVILREHGASVDQILKHISEVDVFHYNGHTFSSSGERGLLLQPNQEIFTAANLRGISLRHCRLAVLATCSSARGTGENMEDASNLTHELLISGARYVVATLWDVDARTSHTMMLSMYAMLSRPMSVAAAISAAQQELRSSPATRHPYFWSAVQVFSQ
jgi:CHAT domain-containing protein